LVADPPHAPVRGGRTARWRGPYLVLGAVGLLILVLTVATHNLGDFARYYRCGELRFLNGDNPYSCSDYYQTPPTLYLLAPFAALGASLDSWAWGLAVGSAIFSGLLLLLRVYDLRDLRSAGYMLALVLCPFTLFMVIFQQISGIVFLLEALAIWFLARRRFTQAALAIALTVFKPHLSLILLPLLAQAPRRAQALAVGLAAGILALLSWPFAGSFLHALVSLDQSDLGSHSTVELREVVMNWFPGLPGWNLVGYAFLVPPFLYFCYETYRLWRGGVLDLVTIGRIVAAGLLWLPYNRAYDWMLAIPGYLALWALSNRRWTPLVIANVGLAWIAFPLSTITYFQHNPISINPLPLVLLIVSLERLAPSLGRRPAPDLRPAVDDPGTAPPRMA
jgi:hypothetical protein